MRNVAFAGETSPVVVATAADLAALQPLLVSPASRDPLVVRIKAGDYVLKDSLRITRSDVRIEAEKGAKFILADGINEPVVAVGTQVETPDQAQIISNIAISGLEIDGNRTQQSSEFSTVRPWIRNNGIDVRLVKNLSLSNVSVNNNRSGGLVISWYCSDVRVSSSTFERNYFDGLAFYASTGVEVRQCTMRNNQGAGISLDNDFVHSRFVDCILENNADVGVFARASAHLKFENCTVRGSGNWGYFLAHDAHDRGVENVSITGGQITGNAGGVWVASPHEKQSRGTRVVGTTFAGNDRTGRVNLQTSGSGVEVNDLLGTPGAGKLSVLNLATLH